MGAGLLDGESRKLVEKRIPLGYIARPDEIARAIVFPASEMSRYMTGYIMLVDGGLSFDISIPGLKYYDRMTVPLSFIDELAPSQCGMISGWKRTKFTSEIKSHKIGNAE